MQNLETLLRDFPDAVKAGFLPSSSSYQGKASCNRIKGANGSEVLVSYDELSKGVFEVSLFVEEKDRRRWGNKALWREFYRIPFDVLGADCLIAETQSAIVELMLMREGWVRYSPTCWAIKRHMVRHLKSKEVIQ